MGGNAGGFQYGIEVWPSEDKKGAGMGYLVLGRTI